MKDSQLYMSTSLFRALNYTGVHRLAALRLIPKGLGWQLRDRFDGLIGAFLPTLVPQIKTSFPSFKEVWTKIFESNVFVT